MRDETRSSIGSGRIFAALPDGSARQESGQIMVSLLLMLSIFLLAIVGFAVDLTNLWFHRQAAQTAADSACQAGAMDMAGGCGHADTDMGFTPGTPATAPRVRARFVSTPMRTATMAQAFSRAALPIPSLGPSRLRFRV